MSSKKYDWIDIAKGICIITIVLMHINFSFWSANVVGKYLASFTSLYKVSLFFCISGLTLKEERLQKTVLFIKDKFKKLYSKVIVIGIIFVLLHNFLIKIGFYSTEVTYAGKTMLYYGFEDIIKQIVLTLCMANREVLIGPLWFGAVLFMAFIGEAILCFLTERTRFNYKREIRLCLCLLGMIGAWGLGNYMGINIPRFNNTFSALFLIDYTQYLVSKKNIKFDNLKIFLASLVICLVCPLIGSFSMNLNQIVNPVFFIVVVTAFMYFVFYSSKKLERLPHKILKVIGSYSFEIMVYQFVGFKVASILSGGNGLSNLIPTASNHFWLVYYALFGIIIPILIGCVINKLKSIVRM